MNQLDPSGHLEQAVWLFPRSPRQMVKLPFVFMNILPVRVRCASKLTSSKLNWKLGLNFHLILFYSYFFHLHVLLIIPQVTDFNYFNLNSYILMILTHICYLFVCFNCIYFFIFTLSTLCLWLQLPWWLTHYAAHCELPPGMKCAVLL